MLKKILPLIVATVFISASMTFAASAQPLRNGASLVVDPVQMAPYVSMSILIKAGAADETADTAGWRQLLVSAIMRATTNGKAVLEGKQLPQAAAAAGGKIGAQVLDDAIVFTAAGDSSSQKELANLLMNVVLHPRLSEADFAAARRGMLRNLNAANRNDVPNHSQATETLQSLLYQDATSKKPLSYGLPPEGTVNSLTALSDDRLRGLYQSYFTPHFMTISLSGDADEAALIPIFDKMSMSPTDIEITQSIISYSDLTPPPSQTIQMRTPAPWTLVGFRIDRHINSAAHDLAAMRVLMAALAETAPSLLSQKLLAPQAKNGTALANQISGQLAIRKYDSELMVAVQSDATHLAASHNAVLQVVNELKTNPLSANQLQAAIAYAQGSWASTRDSSTIRAVLAGYANVQGLFPDNQWPAQLKAVTTADVQNVAKKYLTHSAEVTVNAINN